MPDAFRRDLQDGRSRRASARPSLCAAVRMPFPQGRKARACRRLTVEGGDRHETGRMRRRGHGRRAGNRPRRGHALCRRGGRGRPRRMRRGGGAGGGSGAAGSREGGLVAADRRQSGRGCRPAVRGGGAPLRPPGHPRQQRRHQPVHAAGGADAGGMEPRPGPTSRSTPRPTAPSTRWAASATRWTSPAPASSSPPSAKGSLPGRTSSSTAA